MEGPKFRTIGPITRKEVIARGREIRELDSLEAEHGKGNWRKEKGVALVETDEGFRFLAEVHWYEAHGIGKVRAKIKRRLK